jgi:hypothetical protein
MGFSHVLYEWLDRLPTSKAGLSNHLHRSSAGMGLIIFSTDSACLNDRLECGTRPSRTALVLVVLARLVDLR